MTPSPFPRRWWHRLNQRLKLTREGKYYIILTFGVGFAALNTSNNLLYLLLGLLLSLILVSGILSDISLRGLSVTRKLPPRAQVDRPHLVEIEVRNHKRFAPSYGIEVEDLRAEQPADKRCFFLKINPKDQQVAAYRRVPARRGRDHHVGFRLATRFPFGLFEKSRYIRKEGEVIVYPGVDAIHHTDDATSTSRRDDQRGRPIRADEVIGVRPTRERDEARDIYWKKSFPGRPQVSKDRATPANHTIQFTLNSTYDPAQPLTRIWREQFENRIRDLASRSVSCLRQGHAVRITTTAGDRLKAQPVQGADPLLRFLALVEAAPRAKSTFSAPVASTGPGSESAA